MLATHPLWAPVDAGAVQIKVPKNLFSLPWIRGMESNQLESNSGDVILVVWLRLRRMLALLLVIPAAQATWIVCLPTAFVVGVVVGTVGEMI